MVVSLIDGGLSEGELEGAWEHWRWVTPSRPTRTATIQKWCLLLTGDVRPAYGPLMQGTFFLCRLYMGFIVQGAVFFEIYTCPTFYHPCTQGWNGGIQGRTLIC